MIANAPVEDVVTKFGHRKSLFPTINHLNDVLPAVKDRKDFVVLDKETYVVIDYVCNFPETFPDPETDPNWDILRECRGLIFSKDGSLISRPFRKIFNYLEKAESRDLTSEDLKAATILEKLDGSMIRPLLTQWNELTQSGTWCLATRKGVTDVAMMAEEFLSSSGQWAAYSRFFDSCWEFGYTPIFEFCSRDNRIVLDYPESKLVLLALRNMERGYYMPYEYMTRFAESMPVVRQYKLDDQEDPVAFIRAQEGLEGYVFCFPDGERLKVKADEYVLLHRTKDQISSRNVPNFGDGLDVE